MYGDTTTSGGSIVVLLLLALLGILFFLVPMLVVEWKLFKKAGFKGWEALVPFYGTYIFGLISKKPMWMVWTTIVLSAISSTPIATILGLVTLVFYVILLTGFIEQYSAGIGFWVAFIFLPIVAIFLVDKVNYIGAAAAQGRVEPISGSPISAAAASPTQPVADVPTTPPTTPAAGSPTSASPTETPTTDQAAPEAPAKEATPSKP